MVDQHVSSPTAKSGFRIFLFASAMAMLLIGLPSALTAQETADQKIVGSIAVDESTDIDKIETIGEDRARAIALEAYPGAEIEEVELEVEDGFLIFEVEFLATDGNEYEMVIDAGNGTMLLTENEDEEG